MGLPTVTIIGNVQKIETKDVGGNALTSVNLSCGDKNKKGEWDNLYIKADFWNDASNFVSSYFCEGSAIIVTGKLVTSSYSKQDGTKVYETKFLFPNAQFVPKDREAQDSEAAPEASKKTYSQPTITPIQHPQATPEIDLGSDDIPF